MAQTVYDIVKLGKNNEISAESAIKNFPSAEAYFDELDNFIEKSSHYLRGYNPLIVIYDQNMCKDFLSEIKGIKSGFSMLGMTSLTDALSDVEDAVARNSADTLSDWLIKFHAHIKNTTEIINSARIDRQNTQKPLILAVDDKPELLTSIVNMLEEKLRVMAVTNGKAALKAIEKHTPKLFLLDIEMPEMNGFELAEIIRGQKEYQKTPIIFLTSKSARSYVMEAIKNGGNDYLLKPVNKALLLEKIWQHL